VIAEIQRRLPELDLPFMFVWGMRDRVFQPVFLDQWRELLPDARVVEVEDAAHFVVEDRPDAVSEAIDDFLGSL
jgi:haloalkane dehalogenase